MLEWLLQFVLRRRWLVLAAVGAAALLGLLQLFRLPIDAVPDITNNQVQINTEIPALSPEEVERQVTFPIESSLAGIPGLEYTRSLTRNGFSQVTAVFSDKTDKFFARQQVGERLREAGPSLPPGAEPHMGPISTGLGEVSMWVVEFKHPGGVGAQPTAQGYGWRERGVYVTPEGRELANPRQQAAYLREIQDWVIRPQLRTVPGVAGIEAIGGYNRQVVVEIDPQRLAGAGVTLHQLKGALEENNLNTGAGSIEQQGEGFVVRASSRLRSTQDIENVVVALRGGIPVRVRDVAHVEDGVELRSGSASSNGREVVVGTALMRIGENSRVVADLVSRKLGQLGPSLPPDLEVHEVLNRTTLVDATIRTVARNLSEGAALVIVILFVLLGNLRAALITAMAIPLSVLLTAIGMVEAGISGNLMSLGAIDFGLVVDGAVIIVENCIRLLSEREKELGRPLTGAERLETIYVAARQVRSASAFGEAIIVAVYIPILFLVGVEGKMFHPMAFTVILALVAAFVLSLTFVPAALAVFLTGSIQERESVLLRWAHRAYQPMLEGALRHKLMTIGLAVATFLLGCFIFAGLGREFVPSLDEKNLAMHAVRLPSCGIEQSTALQLGIEEALSKLPQVAVVFSKTGTADLASDPMPPNTSDTFIMLKPDHGMDRAQLLDLIEDTVSQVPGHAFEFTQPIQMRFNELLSGVRGDVAVKVFGDDLNELQRVGEEVAEVLRKVPGGQDVRMEQVSGQPFVVARVKAQEASRLGITSQVVHEKIAAAVRGMEAGEVMQGDRRFPIVIRLPENLRGDLTALRSLPIPLPGLPQHEGSGLNDAFVPLRAVAELEVEVGQNQISRENGKRRVVVTANVRGRDLGSFVEEAREKVERRVKLPSGTWIVWGGQYETMQQATRRLALVVPVCLFLILFLLYSTFSSWRLALLVFVSVPLALSGGVMALALRGMPFSISAAVGLIALSGVAVLNGLVLVTIIDQLRQSGETVHEAVRRGALLRLRPVLMTALVASLGFLPMALGQGTGAEVQRPLATVVIGGLFTATLLTLIVIPALYEYNLIQGGAARVPPGPPA